MASVGALPAGAVEQILAAFKAFDEDGSGLIQRSDLKTVLKAIDADMWSDAAVDSLFTSLSPRSAGDAEAGVPYEAFVASVFAGAAGDPQPLSLAIPKKSGKHDAVGGALREQLNTLNKRLMRLTSGAGKEQAEALAALSARVEEHAAKGGDSRALPKSAASRSAPAASYIGEAFACYDVDSSGYLDIGELAALAKELGVAMDKSEVERMFKVIDTAGNNQISFPEFCAFMSASEVTGSVSQSLRTKLWSRKFNRAAKSLRETMERQGGKGIVKSEAAEPGELVVQLGDDIAEPTLRLKVAGTWEERSSETPLSEAEIATTVRLRLAPPAGLHEGAAQMNEFLQELVEGPPPGWESASVQRVEGSDEVEISLEVKFPVPRGVLEGPTGAAPPPHMQSAGRWELDLASALDFQKLARATAEAPYDVTADARLNARVSGSLVDDSALDNIFACITTYEEMIHGPDHRIQGPEEEWREDARCFKYVVPVFLRWALQARGTVTLPDLAPVLAALCDCRGFGGGVDGANHRQRYMRLDSLLPDLRKATAADVRTALLNICVDSSDIREEDKWKHWSLILSARTALTCVGFLTGATFETVTPYGTAKVNADVSGLRGLHSLVPSYQDLKKELQVQGEQWEKEEAERAERRKNRPTVGDRVLVLDQDRTGEVIQDDNDSSPFKVKYDESGEVDDRYLTEDQVQKLKGDAANVPEPLVQEAEEVKVTLSASFVVQEAEEEKWKEFDIGAA